MELTDLVAIALDEDLVATSPLTTVEPPEPTPHGINLDITGALVPAARIQLTLRSRAKGVFVGDGPAREVLAQVATRFDAPIPTYVPYVSDGESVEAGTTIADITGELPTLLAAERTLLNFLCHLSGIATLTQNFVYAVAGTGAVIRDTRKTTPGLRALEKYAVRCGGGANHRQGLFDAYLIKDNHLAFASMTDLVRQARERHPATPIEVEVDHLDQLEEALALGVELILLDNMDLGMIREAVRITQGLSKLEVSGGVRLDQVKAIAQTGVDFIAVGALTHSAPILDLGLDFN